VSGKKCGSNDTNIRNPLRRPNDTKRNGKLEDGRQSCLKLTDISKVDLLEACPTWLPTMTFTAANIDIMMKLRPSTMMTTPMVVHSILHLLEQLSPPLHRNIMPNLLEHTPLRLRTSNRPILQYRTLLRPMLPMFPKSNTSLHHLWVLIEARQDRSKMRDFLTDGLFTISGFCTKRIERMDMEFWIKHYRLRIMMSFSRTKIYTIPIILSILIPSKISSYRKWRVG
jgi:hypothetical protein